MSWEEEDRHLIIASADEIDQYLASSLLEWHLHGSSVTLTPGNLILSLTRHKVLQGRDYDQKTDDAIIRIEHMISNRRSAWMRKIEMEIPYRIRLWKNLITEFVEDGVLDSSYKNQVRSRVILELIRDQKQFVDISNDELLAQIDDKLRVITRVGAFIWDSVLQSNFDKQRFWFLYVVSNMEE